MTETNAKEHKFMVVFKLVDGHVAKTVVAETIAMIAAYVMVD